jgi:hypothetical protein
MLLDFAAEDLSCKPAVRPQDFLQRLLDKWRSLVSRNLPITLSLIALQTVNFCQTVNSVKILHQKSAPKGAFFQTMD